jgi:hypothetical protein
MKKQIIVENFLTIKNKVNPPKALSLESSNSKDSTFAIAQEFNIEEPVISNTTIKVSTVKN